MILIIISALILYLLFYDFSDINVDDIPEEFENLPEISSFKYADRTRNSSIRRI